MREAFLQYVWKNKIFDGEHLETQDGKKIDVLFPGYHNQDAGPDFLEAKLRIGDILWVGNVEVHLKSSDWYAHGHEKDPAYDNIILHIVYEDDMPVLDEYNNQVPTLNLSKLIPKEALKKYNGLIKNKSILKCQNNIDEIDSYLIFQYKYKLFFERLENKNKVFTTQLNKTKSDWEQVLYKQLLRYFGGTVNKEAFQDLALFLPYEVFRKHTGNIKQSEALLMGTGGMLNEEKNCGYYNELKDEYLFLKYKYNLKSLKEGSIRFHRLRPKGFPGIRLAQLAMLYYKYNHLFDFFMELNHPQDAYKLLQVSASGFWDTHYTFDKSTKKLKKRMGKSFIDRILINVLIPLKFAYLKQRGNLDTDALIHFIEEIPSEKNRIIDIFNKIGVKSRTALDTQAMIELYQKYCTKERCLDCEIGHYLLIKSKKE